MRKRGWGILRAGRGRFCRDGLRKVRHVLASAGDKSEGVSKMWRGFGGVGKAQCRHLEALS